MTAPPLHLIDSEIDGWHMSAKMAALVHLLDLPGYGYDEVGFMTDTVVSRRPGWIYDWGTNRGSSARIWYEAGRLAQLPCEVHTIEVRDEDSEGVADYPGIYTGMFVAGLPVACHRGDGASTAVALSEGMPGRGLLFFIDGDHSPDAAWRDLSLVTEAQPEATVVLHDTAHPGIAGLTGPAQAVRRLQAEGARYDVTELKSQAGMIRLVPC